MSEMFTIYVCPDCNAIEVEPSAAQHDCKDRCGMWVRTSVIEYKAFDRLDRDHQRLRFTLDSVLDRAMPGTR